MSESYDWTQDVQKMGGQPGTHWLGDVEKSALPARFLLKAVENAARSEKLGRPVFEDKLHVEVLMPGGDIMVRKFQAADQYKYPSAWEAWERDQSAPVDGTPLEEWPQITPGAVATLKANNVFTVENLIALSDAHCERIGPVAYMFRQKALDYMKRAEGQNDELDKVKADNEDLKIKLAEMQAAITEMQKPKRRGRPKNKPKVITNEPVADNPGRDGPVGDNQA